jgi:hypothetical protein
MIGVDLLQACAVKCLVAPGLVDGIYTLARNGAIFFPIITLFRRRAPPEGFKWAVNSGKKV